MRLYKLKMTAMFTEHFAIVLRTRSGVINLPEKKVVYWTPKQDKPSGLSVN